MLVGEVKWRGVVSEGGEREERVFSDVNNLVLLCSDVDECSEDDTLCKEGTYCFNTPGNYKCYGKLSSTSSATWWSCDCHVMVM